MTVVFLSSTGRDLQDYRDAAYDALQHLDGFSCDRMERFGARVSVPKALCQHRVCQADLFIGIVGHCYGSRPPDDERSYTEVEYDAAEKLPRLMFVAPDDFLTPAKLLLEENDDDRRRQEDLRARLLSEGTVEQRFNSPLELAVGVVAAASNWINATRLRVEAPPFYSCFISYSSKDDEFARRLHTDLQDKGIRCWFAPEDMQIGAKIRDNLNHAIRLHDKVLLIMSEHSIASDWVENEIANSLDKERDGGQIVLVPIRLDDAVLETKKSWAQELRRTRHIGDFRLWRDRDAYQKSLLQLLRDLKISGKQ